MSWDITLTWLISFSVFCKLRNWIKVTRWQVQIAEFLVLFSNELQFTKLPDDSFLCEFESLFRCTNNCRDKRVPDFDGWQLMKLQGIQPSCQRWKVFHSACYAGSVFMVSTRKCIHQQWHVKILTFWPSPKNVLPCTFLLLTCGWCKFL